MPILDAEARAHIAGLHPELTDLRRDLHRHPELGFEEHRTQATVRAFLERHGWTSRTCATTGVLADLNPTSTGRTIALRADLDCLPMPETTDIPHRSVHEGRAHKCGHDGHTAILLGVAAMLGRARDRITGNVRLVFQPAEEGVDGGGGKRMVAEGAMVGVDEVYGLHNWPPLPRGMVAVRSGAVTAQTHWLNLTVHGLGGHASMPEVCRDPIVAASQIVVALQSVVSRGLGYDGGAVVTIGRFTAGTTDNVIPDFAELEGTVRTFHPDITARVLERIREVVAGTAAAFGVRAELSLEPGYPGVINAAPCAEAVRRVAHAVVGEASTTEQGLPIAGGEDFAYLAQAVPGAFFFVGAGNGQSTPGCHHPDFDFDDRVIPTGIEMFLGLVDDRLGLVG